MIISRFRLITFDVTGTLLTFHTSPGHQYSEIGALYGVLCDKESLSANFKAHWNKMNREHPNFGLYSGLGWERWWMALVKGTFKDASLNSDDKKLEAIASHLIEVYKSSACWKHCHGVSGLLSYVRHKGIPMGIISNFDPRLTTILLNTKLRHYFQFVLSSYEAGIEKPSPKIFEEAMCLSKLKNLDPTECLHVGDRTLLDYYGARNSGWHGIVVNDKSPQVLKKEFPDLDQNHLFPSLYHLHKRFVDKSKDKLSSHSLNSLSTDHTA